MAIPFIQSSSASAIYSDISTVSVQQENNPSQLLIDEAALLMQGYQADQDAKQYPADSAAYAEYRKLGEEAYKSAHMIENALAKHNGVLSPEEIKELKDHIASLQKHVSKIENEIKSGAISPAVGAALLAQYNATIEICQDALAQ